MGLSESDTELTDGAVAWSDGIDPLNKAAQSDGKGKCHTSDELQTLNSLELDSNPHPDIGADLTSPEGDIRNYTHHGQDPTVFPPNISTTSPSNSLAVQWPFDSENDARLFHHFIVHCTPWVDICDPHRHFKTEVPKRAIHSRAILNGLLGLAVRHRWLIRIVPEDLSASYIDAAMQELLVALEDPLVHWDENFLVAVSYRLLLALYPPSNS